MDSNKNPYIALNYPDFRFYILTRICLIIGLQFQSVIVGWHIYSITRDPLSLGLIGLSEILPNFAVTLFAGHYADIYNRKKIVHLCLFVLMFSGIFLFNISHMSMPDSTRVMLMYACIAFTGLARGTLTPAMQSILTECVPKEHYVNSTTWNSTLWRIAFMTGAGLSGFVFAWFSYDAYLIMSGLMVVAIGFFYGISPKPHLLEVNKKTPVFASIKEGVSFIFNNQIILSALTLDLFAVLFGGAVSLLPIFATDILQIGPQGLGFLKGAPSLGSFIMSVIIIYYPPIKDTGKKLLYSVAAFGLCMMFFGLSTNIYLSIFLLALSGAFDCVSVIVRGTILQTFVPANIKGKVFAVNSMFLGSSNELGEFQSGLAARIMGVVPSVVFGSSMTLLVVLTTAIKAPKLRKLQFKDI